jgi:hypothetical protein
VPAYWFEQASALSAQAEGKTDEMNKIYFIIVLFVETPRKFICFHKQNYYIFNRHAKIQRT